MVIHMTGCRCYCSGKMQPPACDNGTHITYTYYNFASRFA